MATVYEIEVVSTWISYSEKELEDLIKREILKQDIRNEVEVKVKIKA